MFLLGGLGSGSRRGEGGGACGAKEEKGGQGGGVWAGAGTAKGTCKLLL